MSLSRGMVVAGLVLGLTAGCGTSSPTSGTATPGSTTTLTNPSPSPPPATSTSPVSGTEDPAATYAAALDKLEEAPSITYTMNASVEMGSNSFKSDRKVSVDADKQLASTRARVRADVPGKPRTDLVMLLVGTPDTVFMTMPSWTDDRKGKWMRVTNESAAAMGVPFELTAPTTVPPGLDQFEATSMPDDTTIEGSLDAQSGLGLLGLTKLLIDPDLSDSLTGRIPATVRIDPRTGSIVEVQVTGYSHTVKAASASMPSGMVEQLVSMSTATIVIKDIGEPVSISEPASKDVLPD